MDTLTEKYRNENRMDTRRKIFSFPPLFIYPLGSTCTNNGNTEWLLPAPRVMSLKKAIVGFELFMVTYFQQCHLSITRLIHRV